MEEIITTKGQLQRVNERLGEWVARGCIQTSRTSLLYPKTPESTSGQDDASSGGCDTCDAPDSYASPSDRNTCSPSGDESCHDSGSSPSPSDCDRGFYSSGGSRNGAESADSVAGGDDLSPDSSIPCDDPACPIGIPHNKGRFYYQGKKADEPTDEELSASQAPPAHFFNFTVPTPKIGDAYRRMTTGAASVEDEDLVIRYVRIHIYSPIVSAPATPRPRVLNARLVRVPCLLFDLKEKDAEEQARQFQVLENLIPEEPDQLNGSGDEEPTPPTHEQVMGAESNRAEETRPQVPPHQKRKRAQTHRIATSGGRTKLQHTEQTADLRAVSRKQERAHLRMVPQGNCLPDAQVSIQERVINQIAQRAIEESSAGDSVGSGSSGSRSSGSRSSGSRSSGSRSSWGTKGRRKAKASSNEGSNRDGSSSRGSSCATWVTVEESEAIDRNLEIHAALSRKLRQDLLDGNAQNLHLHDEQDEPVDRETKFQYMSDILLLVRQSLKQLLGDFDRDYRPTGLEVTDDELVELVGQLMESYEMLLARYPSMKIKDIMSSLDKVGLRGRLENVF